MSTQNEQKIKTFLDRHKPGTVCLAAWLEKSGISRDLQKRYRRSGWLESVGAGAYKRVGEEVGWQGALYALQAQADFDVHAGAMTALSMHGLAHCFRLGAQTVFLFSPVRTALPAWLKRHNWQAHLRHVRTSFLPAGVGLTDHEERTFSIKISAPERAILECLYLAPEEADLVECFQVMEGLVNLRPQLVQQLLAECTSVKVKRLFLYLAEKANHQWLRLVDQSGLDLGTGSRSLAKGGTYVSKYQLVVPEALATL